MTTRRGCLWAVAAGLAAASLTGANADPFKDPKRLVQGHTVDLAPLMRWWKGQSGENPMPDWVRLTGTIAGTNAWGWVLKAKVQGHRTRFTGSAAGKDDAGKKGIIILRNPPQTEAADFESAKTRLKQLSSERARVAGDEKRVESQAESMSHKGRRRALAGYRAATPYRQAEQRDQAQLKDLDKQIAAVKQKLAGYPHPDHFEVDCLALETGQAYQGMRIFDRGLPLK